MEKMIIEVWSDFVCPFCYVGKRKLEATINASPYKDQVEVIYKAYQLDPNAPQTPQGRGYAALAAHKGGSIEKTKEMYSGITRVAKDYGLTYHMDKAQVVNTFKAHRLAKWARTQNAEHALTELMLDGYFNKGANLNDDATLLEYAKTLGLNIEAAQKVLTSDQFTDEVKYEIFEAKQVGAEGVPFFVFDNKYGIAGAQPDELFVRTLKQTMDEFKPRAVILNNNVDGTTSGDGGICGPDDNC